MLKKLIIFFSLFICACYSQAQMWTKVLDSVPGYFQVGTLVKDTINNVLYFGGSITAANNKSCNGIAKYDGVSFDSLRSGVTGFGGVVKSLQMFQNKLYVFGSFLKTGSYNCRFIGRWDGASWDSVNFLPNQPIWWSDVNNNELYVSGWFDTIAGLPIKHVAKFDGTNWHDLSFTAADMTGAIKVYKNKIYVASYTGLWQYSNNVWSPLADCVGDMFRHVYGMTVIDSLLYVYGRFNSLGGVYSKGIVAFDGVKWYGFGQGMSYSGYEIINNVQKIDGKIYITGNFDKIEGIGTSNFTAAPVQSTNYAVLENNQWCLKSGPFENNATGVVKYNNNLYIYGYFKKCANDTIFGFAKWSGGNSSVACSNTFSISYAYVGVAEQVNFSNLKIYPNPVQNIIFISSEDFLNTEYKIIISNSLGQTLYSKISAANNNQIDFSLYPVGVYFVSIQSKDQHRTFKILKE